MTLLEAKASLGLPCYLGHPAFPHDHYYEVLEINLENKTYTIIYRPTQSQTCVYPIHDGNLFFVHEKMYKDNFNNLTN